MGILSFTSCKAMAEVFVGDLCGGCETSEYELVALCYENNEKTIDIFRKHGVLAISPKCPKCNGDLKLSQDKHMWRCSTSFREPNSKNVKDVGLK